MDREKKWKVQERSIADMEIMLLTREKKASCVFVWGKFSFITLGHEIIANRPRVEFECQVIKICRKYQCIVLRYKVYVYDA